MFASVNAVGSAEVDALLSPAKLWRRSEVLKRPSPVPAAPGVYAWWFDEAPADFDIVGCARSGDLTLLYTGISPKRPPQNGRSPSKGHLRAADPDSLRRQCGGVNTPQDARLLALRAARHRTATGGLRHQTHVRRGRGDPIALDGGARLVSWVTRERPWELEDHVIATLDLPLNLDGNSRNAFYADLKYARGRCTARANELPVVANPGIGGR